MAWLDDPGRAYGALPANGVAEITPQMAVRRLRRGMDDLAAQPLGPVRSRPLFPAEKKVSLPFREQRRRRPNYDVTQTRRSDPVRYLADVCEGRPCVCEGVLLALLPAGPYAPCVQVSRKSTTFCTT